MSDIYQRCSAFISAIGTLFTPAGIAAAAPRAANDEPSIVTVWSSETFRDPEGRRIAAAAIGKSALGYHPALTTTSSGHELPRPVWGAAVDSPAMARLEAWAKLSRWITDSITR